MYRTILFGFSFLITTVLATPIRSAENSQETAVSDLVTRFIADYSNWNASASKRFSDPRIYDKSTGVSIITPYGLEMDAAVSKEFQVFAKKYFIREVHYRSIGASCDHQPGRETISLIKQLEPGEWRVVTDVNYVSAGVKFHVVYHYFVRTNKEGRVYIDYVLYRDDDATPPLIFQEL